jgi:uncharacterized protein YecT (DUF1311 family)
MPFGPAATSFVQSQRKRAGEMERRQAIGRRIIGLSFWGLLALAAAGQAPPALAQGFGSTPCDSRPSTPEQVDCLSELLIQADAAMNQAYQRALRTIETDADTAAGRRQEWRTALQTAQRGWIAFRDADCGDLIEYEWQSGSGTGPAQLACRLEKTTQRTRQLTDRYTSR